MRTFYKIITRCDTKRDAPMGRNNVGTKPTTGNIFDCAVWLDKGGYDMGGAYWGIGAQLRVEYTKDLTYIHFYRKEN